MHADLPASVNARPFVILLVEDNPADIRLTQEVLRECAIPHVLHTARDGEQALQMIRRTGEYSSLVEPDLVLLDLNLPRKDGREVLAELKQNPAFCHIPVVILSTSKAERDVLTCYRLHANCYLHKPVDLDDFADLMRVVQEFWLRKVHLPPKAAGTAHER